MDKSEVHNRDAKLCLMFRASSAHSARYSNSTAVFFDQLSMPGDRHSSRKTSRGIGSSRCHTRLRTCIFADKFDSRSEDPKPRSILRVLNCSKGQALHSKQIAKRKCKFAPTWTLWCVPPGRLTWSHANILFDYHGSKSEDKPPTCQVIEIIQNGTNTGIAAGSTRTTCNNAI